ncbi:MAG TPA: hydrogenase [Candidatus Hydrogenedentes bacterium]|nr:hydrogenase [Candidatus Hydrogenedentota bacterium]HOS03392.1 hydrogenase [Candidatus Hydrogenedentota bacterium]
MDVWLNAIMVLLVFSNLILLGAGRLSMYIRCVAFQGFLLGAFTVLAHISDLTVHVWLLASVGTLLRGIVFPAFLSRLLRDSGVRREVEPYIGYTPSILSGLAMLGAGMWLSVRLPAPAIALPRFVVPVALMLIFVGLFLIVTRRKALSQLLGYLVLENGVYVFGVALVQKTPLLVEMGVLLDVFMAVLVMGVAMFHINREFDHIDTDRLSTLKD